MADYGFPPAYLTYNDQSTKEINVVWEIDGSDVAISMLTLFKRINYGDPDIVYGGPGLVYGGVIPLDSDLFKSLISLESNLTISQKIEPEQGKAAVSMMTLVFVDKDQYMTKLLTPGQIVDDPLGNKFVKVRIGYKQTSYPQDYITIFRGYISNTKYSQGKWYVQMSDPNSKRRGQVFFTPKNKLSTGIDDSTTTIPFNTTDYYRQILGPDGAYDSSIHTYIQIDDEVMEYAAATVNQTNISPVTRASRGTVAAAHDADQEVLNRLQIQDNAITIALKVMLSGWDGDWLTDVPILSIQDTLGTEGVIANALVLPGNKNAVDDYGLYPGDYVTVSGSAAGNDGTYVLEEIRSTNGGVNNLLVFTTDFTAIELPTVTAVMAFRSQFDTLPVAAGLKLTPRDVDVQRHIYFRDNFFSQEEYRMRFYIKDAERGKDWIEKELMLPLGCYSITRFGRISMTMARPPIAGEQLNTLDFTNVIEPNSITSERATNTRMYFNDIKYSYDLDDADVFRSVFEVVDSLTISNIEVPNILPIESSGMKTELGSFTAINRRGGFLLNRYKNAAIKVGLKTNWGTGSIIETGDVTLVIDDGQLQIPNFQTGVRNLGQQLFEVIDRQYDIKNGTVALQLMSGVNFQINDRFGTISPSSLVGTGSTTSQIAFVDSFGAVFPGDEKKKWEALVGEKVFVHDRTYSVVSNEVTILPFSAATPYLMNVSPPLNFAPSDGNIIDIISYPNNTDFTDQRLSKSLFCYIDPTVAINGLTTRSFEVVTPSDIDLFTVGLPLLERNSSYSAYSNEALVSDVDGVFGIVTVESAFDIVPSDAEFSEGIGFIDGGGPYRFI